MLHRNPAEVEYSEHRQYAEDGLAILQECHNSMIASRGIKLLSALLEEISIVTQSYNSRKRGRDDEQGGESRTSRQGFNVLAFVKTFSSGRRPDQNVPMQYATQVVGSEAVGQAQYQDLAASMPEPRPIAPGVFDVFAGHDLELDPAFYGQGLENVAPFENLLYLANHDFSFFGA